MASYDYIPKVTTEIVDGNLRVVSEGSLLPKVTLLGVTTNTNVPLKEPFLLGSKYRVSDLDNADGTPSELSKAAQEALEAGATNIEIYVISNTVPADAAARQTDLDAAYDALISHDLDVVVPVGQRIDSPDPSNTTTSVEWVYKLADFCYKATKDFNSVIGVMGTEPVSTTDDISLTQLNSWVTAMDSFDTSSINGAIFDIYDGVTDSSSDGNPDNYKLWATTDGVPALYNGANVIKDDNGNPVDIGAYVSVVAGQYKFTNKIAKKVSPSTGAYTGDGAATYAGFLTVLPPWSAPTNKVIPSVEVIRNMSLVQANTLSKDRFVVFYKKPKGVTVVNAMTGAHHIDSTYKSDFTRLTTVRVVHDAIERVRFAADPFIGEPNNSINRSALASEIEQTLGRLQQIGALRRFDFVIKSTPDMQVLGQIEVELLLVPAFEITEITVRVALGKE